MEARTAEKEVVIFKLGSESKGYIPSKKMFEEFRRDLTRCLKSKAPIDYIVTHPFVKVERVSLSSFSNAKIQKETSKK